jgi:VIT1/CCC1 family predicted Fe2+/Mn2+ transporter
MRGDVLMRNANNSGQRLRHAGWLRAAVLGANDGIVSTASLLLGVIAAEIGRIEVVTAGVAGLVAGAMSMAAGEYVSVSSQADTEKSELERERHELINHREYEFRELVNIYIDRGLTPDLAEQVTQQMMTHDALAAHARDDLGLSEIMKARPLQAAVTSAASFAVGALLPLLATLVLPAVVWIPAVVCISLLSMAILGAAAALVGGANSWIGMLRVMGWGAFAMALTAGTGALFGTVL